MKVYTDDVRKMLNEAIKKYETDTNISISAKNVNYQDFFSNLTALINTKTQSSLKSDTLYKQYFIKIKSHSKQQIGFAIDYLNGLCNYTYGCDYTDRFTLAIEEEFEIPEFPYTHPCFPASTATKINYLDYQDLWIKDESSNPTGIHKDRLAWEVYLFYDKLIKESVLNQSEGRTKIPRISLVSSGNAALAIQYLLYDRGLPNLKVLIDENTDNEIVKALERSRCEIYKTRLSEVELATEDILRLTKNENGIDITYGSNIEDLKMTFYDWLAYEVLNLNPNYLFIPYGSGDLFINILEINHKEIKAKTPSKRFFGNKNILKQCKFIGAATDNPKTAMKMLYAPYNNFRQHERLLKEYYDSETCHKDSNVTVVDEKYLDEAQNIALENNIKCEPSGIAGLALFLQMKQKIPKNQKIVIINTGKMKMELFENI